MAEFGHKEAEEYIEKTKKKKKTKKSSEEKTVKVPTDGEKVRFWKLQYGNRRHRLKLDTIGPAGEPSKEVVYKKVYEITTESVKPGDVYPRLQVWVRSVEAPLYPIVIWDQSKRTIEGEFILEKGVFKFELYEYVPHY